LALLFGRLFYYYVYLPMTYFEWVGIPGPKPTSYLTGSLSLLSKHKNFFNLQEALVKEYGNVVGYYVFQKPNLIVCDPDMVYEIIVKEFDKFVDRIESGSLTPVVADGKKYHGLVFAAEDEWRLTRHSVTPAFSGRKIKLMEPLIKERTVKLSQKLLEFADTGKSVDMLDLFSKMTMEVIMSIAFGRAVDILGGQGGELYRNAKGLLDQYDDGGEVLLKVLVVIGRM
jgi:cytochrome P450